MKLELLESNMKLKKTIITPYSYPYPHIEAFLFI